jgi:hypothetical protein
MTRSIEILKSKITNGKTIILFRNDFNNLHIAIWEGENKNQYSDSNNLPFNFRMTGSYGKNENDINLLEKFNKTISNVNLPNWKNIEL